MKNGAPYMHEWATLKRARRQFLIFCEHHSPASTFLSSCECFRFSNPWLTFIIPLSRKSNKSVNWPDGKLKKFKNLFVRIRLFPTLGFNASTETNEEGLSTSTTREWQSDERPRVKNRALEKRISQRSPSSTLAHQVNLAVNWDQVVAGFP